MSHTVRKAAHEASVVPPGARPHPNDDLLCDDEPQSDLDEQLGDVLTDIGNVLSTPPPPLTGWSAIPPARQSVDDLAELAAQLEAERAVPEPDLIEAFARSDDELSVDEELRVDEGLQAVRVEAGAFEDDEPTQDWLGSSPRVSTTGVAPIPPPVRSAPFLSAPDFGRDEMPSLVDSMDDAHATLRPSAVSLPPYRPAPKRRFPTGLSIGAVAAVAAALLAYRLGPHSADGDARHVAVATQSQTPELHAAPPPDDAASSTDTASSTDESSSMEPQRLLVTVTPSSSHLSIRLLTELEGKRVAGPWPRSFDLAPGDYEVVAFRAGHKPIVRRITVRPGERPAALELRLRVDDIYE